MEKVLADTHCHLNFEVFERDLEIIITRARSAQVCRILIPGVDLVSSRHAIMLAEKYPEVYAAVGIHPNSALEWLEHSLVELRELAKHPKVVAIGEIGLDYYRDMAPIFIQKRIFLEQLSLATENGLPVILHNRLASNDMLDILNTWHAENNGSKESESGTFLGVMHSYSDNLETALEATDLGFMIGVTGLVTFRKMTELQNAILSLPLERLLIETDAPYLTPHPYRWKRNEPAYVVYIAEAIARLKGITFDDVARATTANADQLFHWREIY